MSKFCHFTDIYSIGQMSEYVLFYGHLSYRLDVYRSDGVTPRSFLLFSFQSWISNVSCSYLNRINFKIFLTAICIPICTVGFDLVYSDTMVIKNLCMYAMDLKYINAALHCNGAITRSKSISIDNQIWSLLMMMFMLSVIYVFSILGLLFSPFVSSLETSYKTSVSLLKEHIDMSTPVGGSFVEVVR